MKLVLTIAGSCENFFLESLISFGEEFSILKLLGRGQNLRELSVISVGPNFDQLLKSKCQTEIPTIRLTG